MTNLNDLEQKGKADVARVEAVARAAAQDVTEAESAAKGWIASHAGTILWLGLGILLSVILALATRHH